MRILVLVLAVAVGGLAAASGAAAGVRVMEVERKGEAYHVRFEAVVGLAPDRVFGLLTDYDRLERLHPGILEAERLPDSGPDAPQGKRVRTVLEGCVAFFCRETEKIETVHSSDGRLIRTRIQPDGSDFRSGTSRWELAAVSEGTRLRYRSEWVPDFWIPGALGNWAVKRELERNLRELVQGLEARGRARDKEK